jgi:hypothetical protein
MKTPIIALSSSSTKMLADRFPGSEQGERRQEGGQREEQKADAVDTYEILDAERRHPGVTLHELKVARSGVEARPEEQRLRENQQRHHERDVANERGTSLFVAPDQKEQNGPHDGKRDDRREDRKGHHR